LSEADIHRIRGEIALLSSGRDTAKAEAYFDRALAVARKQQAKSWELRAAMSMARLWRDQGKRQQAHDLPVPIYGWFTEVRVAIICRHARRQRSRTHSDERLNVRWPCSERLKLQRRWAGRRSAQHRPRPVAQLEQRAVTQPAPISTTR
jgi:hypothetical protein